MAFLLATDETKISNTFMNYEKSYSKCSIIALSKAGGVALTTSSTLRPSLKNQTVGIALIPTSCEIS
jgi:hypothetical protein